MCDAILSDGCKLLGRWGDHILADGREYLGIPLNWRVGQRHWPMGVNFGALHIFFVFILPLFVYISRQLP